MIRQLNPVFGLLLLLLLVGCGTTQPTRFYLLTAQATAVQADDSLNQLMIGVGPIRLAAYLDRPQIVTRLQGSQLAIDEFDRWAEGLENSVKRVVAENLSQLLGSESVVSYPWERAVVPDYQVAIDILELDMLASGGASFSAQWRILGDDGRVLQSIERSRYQEQLAGADYGQLVAAQNRALARLSEEIASTLRRLYRDR